MFKVSTVIVGLILLMVIFSRVASADYPCILDCPESYVETPFGNISWQCPHYHAMQLYDRGRACHEPVIEALLLPNNQWIVNYAEHGNINHRTIVMQEFNKIVRYQLLE